MAKGGFPYTVVRGDSLWGIAERVYGHGKHWPMIAKANPGKVARNGDLILIGTTLNLPALLDKATVTPKTSPSKDSGSPAGLANLGASSVPMGFGKCGARLVTDAKDGVKQRCQATGREKVIGLELVSKVVPAAGRTARREPSCAA